MDDILHDNSQTTSDNFIANIDKMVKKCRNAGVGKIFIFGLVYSKKVDLTVLERIHTTLVSFCSNSNCLYIDGSQMDASWNAPL